LVGEGAYMVSVVVEEGASSVVAREEAASVMREEASPACVHVLAENEDRHPWVASSQEVTCPCLASPKTRRRRWQPTGGSPPWPREAGRLPVSPSGTPAKCLCCSVVRWRCVCMHDPQGIYRRVELESMSG
jgi:hypothetical protein